MTILSPTNGTCHLRLLPQVDDDESNTADAEVPSAQIDVEIVLSDPRLHGYGFRGPGLGYRRVAYLTVCEEA